MNYDFEALKILIGEKIIRVETEISAFMGISDDIDNSNKNQFQVEIPLKIVFYNYILFIYNKWFIDSILPMGTKELEGHEITEIEIFKEMLELKLNDDGSIKIDVSDDGFTGPEAMTLYGPNNLIVVWN